MFFFQCLSWLLIAKNSNGKHHMAFIYNIKVGMTARCCYTVQIERPFQLYNKTLHDSQTQDDNNRLYSHHNFSSLQYPVYSTRKFNLDWKSTMTMHTRICSLYGVQNLQAGFYLQNKQRNFLTLPVIKKIYLFGLFSNNIRYQNSLFLPYSERMLSIKYNVLNKNIICCQYKTALVFNDSCITMESHVFLVISRN